MEEFCEMATSAESNSEHPIAKAVVDHAKKLRQKCGSPSEHIIEAKDFEVHPGVRGKVGDKEVLVGNKRLMRNFSMPIRCEVEVYVSEAEYLAGTCVLVAIERRVAGAFAVTDPVKPEAMGLE